MQLYKQVINLVPGRKRGRRRPRRNWPESIREELRGQNPTWKDALDAAVDRMDGENALPNAQFCTERTKVLGIC